jgi:hypothetical protein
VTHTRRTTEPCQKTPRFLLHIVHDTNLPKLTYGSSSVKIGNMLRVGTQTNRYSIPCRSKIFSSTPQRPDWLSVELTINNELEGFGRECSRYNLWYYPGIYIDGLRKTVKNFNQPSLCPYWDSNLAEENSRTLMLKPACFPANFPNEGQTFCWWAILPYFTIGRRASSLFRSYLLRSSAV